MRYYNPDLKDLARIFQEEDCLIVFESKYKPIITLGAPHQVPKGKNKICSPERNGDTSSGILAINIFQELENLRIPTKLVIKSRATGVDPNKFINTDYSQEVLNSDSIILFEIHGQSERNRTPLEFSAGRNDISKITRFGLFFYEELRQLQRQNLLEYIYPFAVQERKDSKKAIKFTEKGEVFSTELVLPALKSAILDKVEDLNMSAFHLEATPEFRFRGTINRKLLSIALSKALYKLLVNKDFKDI